MQTISRSREREEEGKADGQIQTNRQRGRERLRVSVCVCVSLLLLFCFFKSTFVGNDYWDRQYKTPSSDKATLMAIRSLFDYIFLGLRENGLFLSHFEAACHKQGSET